MIAPDSTVIPAYAAAPVARQLEISAYIGTPICGPDGTLFGTLCAIDPNPKAPDLERELPLVRLISKMLATVLSAEFRMHEERRRAEREETAANQDPLTGVGTRRFWEMVLEAEEERCRVLGTRAAVVIVDLDRLKEVNDTEGHHAGDALLAAGARAISGAVRQNDVVARIGGDEFAVLAVDCNEDAIVTLADRIRRSLTAAGVESSVGYSMREPRSTIDRAWRAADEQMYVEKRQRAQAA
jgi:diguanylate cyclase (GGDEF)-like protein